MLQGGVKNYEKIEALVYRIIENPSTDLANKFNLTIYLKNQSQLQIYEKYDISQIESVEAQMIHREGYALVLCLVDQFNRAYEQAKILLDLAEKHNDQSRIIKANIIIADCYIAQMKKQEAMSIYDELLRQINDPETSNFFTLEDKADIYTALGGFYQNINPQKALDYLALSRKYFQELYSSIPNRKNQDGLLNSTILYALGLRTCGLGSGLDMEKVNSDYIKESTDILLNIQSSAEQACKEDFRRYFQWCFVLYRTLAENYFSTKEYQQSEKFFLNALNLHNKAAENSMDRAHYSMVAEVYNNLGFLYNACKEYSKAEQAYIKSIDVVTSAIQKTGAVDLYSLMSLCLPQINVAVLYVDLKRYDMAKQYGYKGLKNSEILYSYSTHFKEQYVLILKTLALAEMGEQQFDKAKALIDKAISVSPDDTALLQVKEQITTAAGKK
jgi:tetratricopeptide (TPR) repeat protein